MDTHYKRPELGRINSTQTIHTATGQEVSLDGPYKIDIDYIPTQVYFTQGANNGIPILASDFLRARSARIDYSNNTLELDGNVRPLALPGQLASVGPLDEISKVVLEHLHIFEQKGVLPAMDVGVEMSIETEGGPISLRPYRAPLSKRFIIDKEIEDMLAKGIIRPSASPWASPVLLVPKADSGTRYCVDYRQLNSVTVKDRYPLPRIEDIFDSLGGSTIFSVLDLK